MSRGEGFVARTGQSWKTRVGMFWLPVLSVAGTTGLVKGLFGLKDDVAGFLLMIVNLGIPAAVVWVVRSLRCPSCGARLLWKAITEQPIGEWATWLEALLLCPVCGSAGDDVPSSRR